MLRPETKARINSLLNRRPFDAEAMRALAALYDTLEPIEKSEAINYGVTMAKINVENDLRNG